MTNFSTAKCAAKEVHRLAQPYWAGVQPIGEVLPLANLQIEIPVAPSKLIAVGLNYADHIAEMKRTEFGAPLIWFKAPSSLLAHNGVIEVAFTEHQTDFEVELAVVDRHSHEECQRHRCAPSRFRLHDRPRHHRSRSAKTREAIWPLQIIRHLHADWTIRVRECGCSGCSGKVVAERRAAPEHAHESNDPSGCTNYFVCESVAHTSAGRRDFNGDARWRRPNSGWRSTASGDR